MAADFVNLVWKSVSKNWIWRDFPFWLSELPPVIYKKKNLARFFCGVNAIVGQPIDFIDVDASIY